MKQVDLIKLAKGKYNQLTQDLENIDTFTETLNMAWLEDLFTRQKVPILLYNKLNLDELRAIHEAVRHRDAFVDDLPGEIPEFKGNPTPGDVTLILYEKLLERFYYHMEKAEGDKSSTFAKLSKAQSNFDCVKISGLLKVDAGSFNNGPYLLTGTGKEVFYLLSKGATPYLCGEFFILSPVKNSYELAKKLAAIPKKQKVGLEKYDHPMKQEPKYSTVTTKFANTMPFLKDDPDSVEPQLFQLS